MVKLRLLVHISSCKGVNFVPLSEDFSSTVFFQVSLQGQSQRSPDIDTNELQQHHKRRDAEGLKVGEDLTFLITFKDELWQDVEKKELIAQLKSEQVTLQVFQSFRDPGGKTVSEICLGSHVQDIWSFLFLSDLFYSNKYDFVQNVSLVSNTVQQHGLPPMEVVLKVASEWNFPSQADDKTSNESETTASEGGKEDTLGDVGNATRNFAFGDATLVPDLHDSNDLVDLITKYEMTASIPKDTSPSSTKKHTTTRTQSTPKNESITRKAESIHRKCYACNKEHTLQNSLKDSKGKGKPPFTMLNHTCSCSSCGRTLSPPKSPSMTLDEGPPPNLLQSIGPPSPSPKIPHSPSHGRSAPKGNSPPSPPSSYLPFPSLPPNVDHTVVRKERQLSHRPSSSPSSPSTTSRRSPNRNASPPSRRASSKPSSPSRSPSPSRLPPHRFHTTIAPLYPPNTSPTLTSNGPSYQHINHYIPPSDEEIINEIQTRIQRLLKIVDVGTPNAKEGDFSLVRSGSSPEKGMYISPSVERAAMRGWDLTEESNDHRDHFNLMLEDARRAQCFPEAHPLRVNTYRPRCNLPFT